MDWNKDKPEITEAYFIAINANNIKLFEIIKANYDLLEKVFPLIEYILERVNAVTTLVKNEQIWDADIIVRSALETLIKFAFLSDSEESDRPQLLNEFWNDLSEIYNIKLSEQAKKNLQHSGKEEIYKLAYTPLILGEEEENRLRIKWPKSARSKLEQKWSFTGIVNFLAHNQKDKAMGLIEFVTHTYRMSSHVAHGDEIGINLIRERESRPTEEREAAHISHYLRLLSDCFSFCYLTALYTTKYIKTNPKSFMDIANSLKQFDDLIHQYQMIPFQDKSYNKFK